MKIVNSKLFNTEVAIVGKYEKKPTDKIWFTEEETKAMQSWSEGNKKMFFEIKQAFGSESTIECR